MRCSHPHRIAALSIFLLTACAQSTDILPNISDQDLSLDSSLYATQFTDIAVPDGVTLNLDHSLILGDYDIWTGRLHLESDQAPDELYSFYRREMPRFGWLEIGVARGDISLLTYFRNDRMLIIEISKSALSGSSLTILKTPTTTRIQTP